LLVSGWAGGIGASMLSAPLLGAGRFGSAFGPSALAATSLLRRSPVHSSRRCSCRGSAGIRTLQSALVDLAETAWRGDHRRELEHLRGLDEIHRALAQLESAR
jgi:hypothetical protein